MNKIILLFFLSIAHINFGQTQVKNIEHCRHIRNTHTSADLFKTTFKIVHLEKDALKNLYIDLYELNAIYDVTYESMNQTLSVRFVSEIQLSQIKEILVIHDCYIKMIEQIQLIEDPEFKI